jgi:hypothetical protein
MRLEVIYIEKTPIQKGRDTKRGPTSKAETTPNNKMEDKVLGVLA